MFGNEQRFRARLVGTGRASIPNSMFFDEGEDDEHSCSAAWQR